jgi:hypothetical protein
MTTVSAQLAAAPIVAGHLAAVHLADGPAMYFGGTIMTFALPLGAFIVIALSLFFLFRTKHSGPPLRYLRDAPVTSVMTWEPGPVPAPPVAVPAAKESAVQAPAAEEIPTKESGTGQQAGDAPVPGNTVPGNTVAGDEDGKVGG